MKSIKHRPILFPTIIMLLLTLGLSAQNLENLSEQKPIQLHSGLSFQTNFYSADGIDPRQDELAWFISGTPKLSVYGVDLPFSFTFSNQHKNYQQPFNQFGVTPTYKWAKMFLGHTSVNWSPFILAGRRFLGVGTELHPGWFRCGAMRGRFQKPIAEDLTIVEDPNNFLIRRPQPAYERKGTAFKAGFIIGGKHSWLDFILFKAEDDPESIARPLEDDVRPAENVAFGISWNYRFFKKLTWKGDAAFSAYSRDLFADTIVLKRYAPWQYEFQKLLQPRESSQIYTAGESTLTWKSNGFMLQAKYRRIDPEYKSMGAYFFQTDIEQYTLSANFGLWKNKVRINGSFGLQHNNLYELKTRTSDRKIGSAGIAINPNRNFGLNIQYTNFGFTQNPTSIGVMDTVRLEQVSQSLTVMPRLSLFKNGLIHVFTLTAAYNELADRSKSSGFDAGLTALTLNFLYNLNLTSSAVNMQGGLFYRQTENAFLTTSFRGFRIGAGKSFAEGKFTANAGFNFFQNLLNESSNGLTQQITLTANYKIGKHHGLFVNLFRTGNSGAQNTGKDFSEFAGRTGYTLNF